MTSNKTTEQEFAFEWSKSPQILDGLDILSDWVRSATEYFIVDSLYDAPGQSLAEEGVGVRIRSKGSGTELTLKRYLGKGESGESLFEEHTESLTTAEHPNILAISSKDFKLPVYDLVKVYTIHNQRTEYTFKKDRQIVRLINEAVTYSNTKGAHLEHLLEVEFENTTDLLIRSIRKELETNYPLKIIAEGKGDRAKRFLPNSSLYVENIDSVLPLSMSAHGGKGKISMKFFHTAFSRFDGSDDPKSSDYLETNWEFFAHAVLPVGAEVKEHLHDKTDEIYFILRGSATFTVDGESKVIGKGDCILTRKNSSHSLSKVTSDLEFIALEIL